MSQQFRTRPMQSLYPLTPYNTLDINIHDAHLQKPLQKGSREKKKKKKIAKDVTRVNGLGKAGDENPLSDIPEHLAQYKTVRQKRSHI